MFNVQKIIIKIKSIFPTRFKTRIKKLRKFNGYNDLDKKMLEYINFQNGFYVDCGANDGVNQSTTWYYEKYLNWRGLLVEPIPSVFNELKKNRNKNNFFENSALTSRDHKEQNTNFYYDEKDTLTGSVDKRETTKKIIVKLNTFDQVFEKINYTGKINFFSLDVEGNEFKVLDGINFDKYNIEYMLIETDNFIKLKNYLKEKNYVFLKRLSNYKFSDRPDYGDYLFKKNI